MIGEVCFVTTAFLLVAVATVQAYASTIQARIVSKNSPRRDRWMDRPLKSRNLFASWSQYAEFDREGTVVMVNSSASAGGCNLISPREWLEYHEAKGRCCGAYTVIRCDLSASSRSWRIWENHFHWKRLRDSYDYLTDQCEIDWENAIEQTENLLSTLLISCQISLLNDYMAVDKNSYCTCMVTVLWQKEQEVCVTRVHAFSTGIFSNPFDYSPMPIKVALALGSTPNRYDNKPRAKLSSWCRVRRPLEDQFKDEHVVEVFLTRQDDKNKIELLEGLTSNLFVLYRNGTLRTPDQGILEGCARNQVLLHASALGFTVECASVTLENLDDWEEVFCTSAIRIIVPVSQVVEGKDGRTVWQSSTAPHQWRKFYESILMEALGNVTHETSN
jgi:Amino-transferase class IV